MYCRAQKKWGHNQGNRYNNVLGSIHELAEKGFFMSGEWGRSFWTLRLGLQGAIFSASFCRQFHSKHRRFSAQCTRHDFLHSSLLMIWRRWQNRVYQDPFFRLNSVPTCECSSIWSCLLHSQHLHTSLRFYMDKLSILHKDVPRKNRSRAYGQSPIYFNVICLFCRIVRRVIHKKSPKLTVLKYWKKKLFLRKYFAEDH